MWCHREFNITLRWMFWRDSKVSKNLRTPLTVTFDGEVYCKNTYTHTHSISPL